MTDVVRQGLAAIVEMAARNLRRRGRLGSGGGDQAPVRLLCMGLFSQICILPCLLNETSINPSSYGEPFVKRHGLFSMTVASRHGVVSGCVGRQDHDRSAVH
jgi:hypothetical protein